MSSAFYALCYDVTIAPLNRKKCDHFMGAASLMFAQSTNLILVKRQRRQFTFTYCWLDSFDAYVLNVMLLFSPTNLLKFCKVRIKPY